MNRRRTGQIVQGCAAAVAVATDLWFLLVKNYAPYRVYPRPPWHLLIANLVIVGACLIAWAVGVFLAEEDSR